MKKYKHLFDKICLLNNFWKAYNNAIKNKNHYTEVKFINKCKFRYIPFLKRIVENNTYKVSNYIIFNLWSGNKWREIYKLPMKDRIVQHAIMNIIEPIFRETFIIDIFQSIKGRGIHRGLKRVKHALKDKKNTKYCLKLDVHKCYPSLDQTILKNKLARKFKDKKLIRLLYKIIDSCDKGVPIGNYTSQYFNNFYFSDLDHYCKEVLKIKYYYRYCDDIVILGATKEQLRYWFSKIQIKINELNVQLKDNYQIFPVDVKGVDFLGYIIYRDHVLLRKRTKLNFIRKCKSMDFDNLTPRDINVLGSYWGIIKHCNGRNLWLKYTSVKEFKDLHVKTHEREFIKNILDKEIIVKDITTYFRKGEKRIRLTVDYDDKKDVYISTSGEIIIEAGTQLKKNMFPFKTTITVNNNGYFIFT